MADPRTRTSRLIAAVTAAIVRRRSLALGLSALVFLLAVAGALRLRLDFSSTAFYGDGSAASRALAEHQARWGADDDVLLVLVSPREPDDPAGVVSPARLTAIAELSAALESAPEVVAVTSAATLPGPGGVRLGELARAVDLANQTPAQRQATLERLPFVPTLLSATGELGAIAVQLRFSSDDVLRTRAAVGGLEAVLADHDEALAAVGLTRALAGVPATRASFAALVLHDQMIFVPATLTIIGLALLLVFRRLHGVLIPAVAAAAPTAMLVGIMGWTGEPIGLLNQAYFTLLPVIAVADAIHYVARFHEERRADPSATREAVIVRAGASVGVACLLTSLTTGAGFASLALARMPILRGFGLYAALGVILAFAAVLVVVPLALSFVDADAQPRPASARILDAIAGASLRRPWLTLVACLGLCAAALIPAARVTIDNQLSGLLQPSHPTSVAGRRVDAELGGVLGLEFELRASPDVDLRAPAILAAIHGFENWLAEQPEVRSVEGLGTAVARSGPLVGEAEGIPDARVSIDARLRVLAPLVPLERVVMDDGRSLRIHAGMPDDGGQRFVVFADEAEAELQRRLAQLDLDGGAAIEARATGTALLAYRGVNGITADLRRSFALVFAVVVAVIAALFRSPWPALASLLPNAAPLLLGYALLGLLGVVLDPLAAVILTLALGIAVDDTLHVMVRTREELGSGAADLEAAIRAAIRHSGRAVALTSVVIVGGLALNCLASFPPLRLLGLLGSVVIALALVADIVVLPAVLIALRGRGLSRALPG